MTILQAGKLPEKKVSLFRGTCSHCGCQVECNSNEAEYDLSGWYLRCPTSGCRFRITLKEVVLRQDGPLKATLDDINKAITRDTIPDCKIQPIKDVHTQHCCALHGCKYGDDDCTVVNKRAPQSFCCERCGDDGIYDMDDLKRVIAGITETCPYCQHTLP